MALWLWLSCVCVRVCLTVWLQCRDRKTSFFSPLSILEGVNSTDVLNFKCIVASTHTYLRETADGSVHLAVLCGECKWLTWHCTHTACVPFLHLVDAIGVRLVLWLAVADVASAFSMAFEHNVHRVDIILANSFQSTKNEKSIHLIGYSLLFCYCKISNSMIARIGYYLLRTEACAVCSTSLYRHLSARMISCVLCLCICFALMNAVIDFVIVWLSQWQWLTDANVRIQCTIKTAQIVIWWIP